MKLPLIPPPTFTTTVNIPLHGTAGSAPVVFTFKHRTKSALESFLREAGDSSENDVVTYQQDLILKMAEGWDLDDEFTPDNVTQLVQAYGGAASAVLDAYVSELTGNRKA